MKCKTDAWKNGEAFSEYSKMFDRSKPCSSWPEATMYEKYRTCFSMDEQCIKTHALQWDQGQRLYWLSHVWTCTSGKKSLISEDEYKVINIGLMLLPNGFNVGIDIFKQVMCRTGVDGRKDWRHKGIVYRPWIFSSLSFHGSRRKLIFNVLP